MTGPSEAAVEAAARQMWTQARLGADWNVLPEVTKDHWRRSAGPVVAAVVAVQTQTTPVVGHEQEVRGDWEYGFTYTTPTGAARTEWGFTSEPTPDSEGEIEVSLDEWVTVTSIVRRRFGPPETVHRLPARSTADDGEVEG